MISLLQMKERRVTYTRRHAYATKSNKIKVIRTPGGKLVAHYQKKKANGPKCGDCKTELPGVSSLVWRSVNACKFVIFSRPILSVI